MHDVRCTFVYINTPAFILLWHVHWPPSLPNSLKKRGGGGCWGEKLLWGYIQGKHVGGTRRGWGGVTWGKKYGEGGGGVGRRKYKGKGGCRPSYVFFRYILGQSMWPWRQTYRGGGSWRKNTGGGWGLGWCKIGGVGRRKIWGWGGGRKTKKIQGGGGRKTKKIQGGVVGRRKKYGVGVGGGVGPMSSLGTYKDNLTILVTPEKGGV